AAKIMFDEEVQLPGKFCFVEGQAAGNRLLLISSISGLLDLRDEIDRAFLILVAFVFGCRVVNAKQLPVAQIFLDYHAAGTINRIDIRDGYGVLQKKARYVEIRMEIWIKRFGVNGGDGPSLLPGNAEVVAR